MSLPSLPTRLSSLPFVLVFLCVAPLVGCTRHFVPTTPRAPVDVDGLRVRLVGLDAYSLSVRPARTGTRVRIEVEAAPPDARLTEASYTDVTNAPCTATTPARFGQFISSSADHRGPLFEPHSQIAFDFPEPWGATLQASKRLDLAVEVAGERRCLSVDVTSPAPEGTWTSPDKGVLSYGGLGGMSYAHPVNGSVGSLHFSTLFVGGWAGPFRLNAGTAFAIDLCSTSLCTDANKKRSGAWLSVPLYLRADVFPVRTQHVAFGLGARYALFATWKDPVDADKLTAYQSFALTPLISITAPKHTPNGIDEGVPMASLDLELPIGIATALDRLDHAALAIGGGMYFTFGF